ncbi:MAG: matrixin family metalloprotease [Patescibacteria group bacterium]
MQFTKNAFVLILILVSLGGYLSYQLYTRKIPCVTPIRYALVQVDPKFEVSEAEIKTLLAEAAAVWNDVLDADVFVAGEKPDLPVYFVYGRVQQAVDTLATLGEDIDAAKAEATKIANEYGALKKQYDAARRQGRVTQALVDELNTLQAKYYQLRDRIEADLAKSRGAIPQGDIQEGKFVLDEQGMRIYMYGYQNKTGLERALIHEFGHALGLDHVQNKASIMYPDNSSTNLKLTAEDLTEMKKVCNL